VTKILRDGTFAEINGTAGAKPRRKFEVDFMHI
jgi:hypothetical protein